MDLKFDSGALHEERRVESEEAADWVEETAVEAEDEEEFVDVHLMQRCLAPLKRWADDVSRDPRSCLVFAPNSGFRRSCAAIAEDRRFAGFVAACIGASSCILAVIRPLRHGETEEPWVSWVNYALTGVFAFEAAVKIIASGFAFGRETYLSQWWNRFDFLLVTASVIFLPFGGNQVIALRLFRALHSFRIFARYRSARLAMQTIGLALPLLGDVVLFLLWFIIAFAACGVTLFGGKMSGRWYGMPPSQEGNASYVFPIGSTGSETCARLVLEWMGNATAGETGTYPDEHNSTCAYASWNTNSSSSEWCCDSGIDAFDGFLNFDNAFRAAIVTLNGITIDGWNELLIPTADAVGYPRAFVWFILVVIFGGFFVMELFTSVICATLESVGNREANQEAREAAQNGDNAPSKDDVECIVMAPGDLEANMSTWRSTIRDIVEADLFDSGIIVVIMLSTALMMTQHYNASSTFTFASTILEYIFLGIFGVEMMLKHVAYGYAGYWRSKENALDGFIVLTGVISAGVSSQGVSVSFLRILRLGRAFRTIRVIRRNAEFRRIVMSASIGLQDMWPFLVVWFLFQIIFAIYGFQLFSGLGTLDEARLSFKNVLRSLLTLFVVATGEDSFTVAWSTIQATGTSAAVFYTIAWIFVSTVILSLVLGILIDSCALVELTEDQILQEERERAELEEAVKRAGNFKLSSIKAAKRKLQNMAFAANAFRSKVHTQTDPVTEQTLPAFQEVEESAKRLQQMNLNEFKSLMDVGNRPVEGVGSLANVSSPIGTGGKIAQNKRAKKRKEALDDVAAVRIFLTSIGFKIALPSSVVKLSSHALEEAQQRLTPKLTNKERKAQHNKLMGELSDQSDSPGSKHGVELHGPWAAAHVADKEDSKKKAKKHALEIPGVIITKDGAWIPKYDESITIERYKSAVNKVVGHKMFENIILLLILSSSVLLATETKNWPAEGSTAATWYALIDITFTIIFTIEMGLKVFAFGLYKRPTAYLRGPFNVLDAIVVISSLASLAIGNAGGGAVRALRVLRIARPLRTIRRFPGIRLVVNTVITSIPAVSYVCLLGLASMSIFALIGMEIFMGQFWSCRVVENASSYHTQAECISAGGKWRNSKFNFDNFASALLSTFILHAGDDWQNIMWVAMDTTSGEDTGLLRDHNQPAALYFVACVAVGNFFWLNLLVTALVDNFNKMSHEDKLTLATPAQRRWQQAILRASHVDLEAWRNILPPPGNDLWSRLRLKAHSVTKNSKFSRFILIVVIANLVEKLAQTANMSENVEKVHFYLIMCFSGVYAAEFILLWMAQGTERYFKSYWNWLDTFVVVVSVADMVGQVLNLGGFMSYLQLVRLMRLLKLVNAHQGLRSLFTTFIMSLPAVGNVAALSSLVIFAYAIMGVSLFGEYEGPYEGDVVSKYSNFRNFATACSSLVGVYTGGWVGTFAEVYQTEACLREEPPFRNESDMTCSYNYLAVPYFLSFVIITIFLLGNLFVAIVLERFATSAEEEGLYDVEEVVEIIKHTIQLRRLALTIKKKVLKAHEPGGRFFKQSSSTKRERASTAAFQWRERTKAGTTQQESPSSFEDSTKNTPDNSSKGEQAPAQVGRGMGATLDVKDLTTVTTSTEGSAGASAKEDEVSVGIEMAPEQAPNVLAELNVERREESDTVPEPETVPEPVPEPETAPEPVPEPELNPEVLATILGGHRGENRFKSRFQSVASSEAGAFDDEVYPFERNQQRTHGNPGLNTTVETLSERAPSASSMTSHEPRTSDGEDTNEADLTPESFRFTATGGKSIRSRQHEYLNDALEEYGDNTSWVPSRKIPSLVGSVDGDTSDSEDDSDEEEEEEDVSHLLERL